jgi:tetratricopeptide (TPR) repeat protein
VTESKRIDELRRRVQKDPASLAFAQLAEELRRAGELQDAIRVCRTGLAQHPEYLSARVTLGRALLASEQLDAAFTELSTALAAAPENLAALRGLAEIQHRRGDLQESLALYRRALALAPQDPDLAAAVTALEPSAAQSWPTDPASPALPEPAPVAAITYTSAAVADDRLAVDSADPSGDFASQQASLAAFYGEAQPEAEADGPGDWLASLDAAAANILRADVGVQPAGSEPEIPVVHAQPTDPIEPTQPLDADATGQDERVEVPQITATPDSTPASVQWVPEVAATPEPTPEPAQWVPDVAAIPESTPVEVSGPDPEAVRAEVLQRWLDAILASRSGQQSLDDRA